MNEIREKKALLRKKILKLRQSADPGTLAELSERIRLRLEDLPLWTDSGYRGKGVAHYVLRMRQQYLRENGVVATKGAIPLDNQASLRVPRSGRSKAYATGHYIRILLLHHWKETPFDEKAEQAAGEQGE